MLRCVDVVLYRMKGRAMIESGSKVKLHFVGTLADGRVFYSTHIQGGTPMEITIGKHEILPSMEQAIIGMQPGDRKVVTIPAKDAYGEYDASLKECVPENEFPNALELPVGDFVVFNTDAGPLRVKVESIEDGLVTFDYNHELAGQDLTFKIDVLNVMSPGQGAIEHEDFYREDECGCKQALGVRHDDECDCGHVHGGKR